jgi:hypothetical protein
MTRPGWRWRLFVWSWEAFWGGALWASEKLDNRKKRRQG